MAVRRLMKEARLVYAVLEDRDHEVETGSVIVLGVGSLLRSATCLRCSMLMT